MVKFNRTLIEWEKNMLSKERLFQLVEMESILDEANVFLAEAEQFLEKWQAFLPKMKRLEHYYFGGD